ncbi:hypothetical protein M378DRAFT_161777 [Amanita muscaria Koide BX008]|uniref:AB hydrolase-1 domain-containing protein n=1 Tax=Amanita muscaria (strain Koide BX008) TaxID=946122 RepID=A0A0C2WVG4_AMAMK|nr:hypothetical protein M378DRAFT_161777 [Amanita muscaria Koide BX008]
MAYQTLELGSGVDIAYTDSGAPSQPNYITIIAIHGMCFCAPIFKRAQAAALEKGVRFVAINRRNYPGSTAFTLEEIHALSQGSEGQRSDFLKDRAHEIATFIDRFIQKNHLPPISSDGKSGGVILLGWSLGCAEAAATIAHADSLPSHIRLHLSSHLRALVIYEAGARVLGKPNPPKDWSPYAAECLPSDIRGHAFAQWVTAYFDHGDLSTRDPDVLSYILPSTSRPGTIYNMTKPEQEEVIRLGYDSAWEISYFTRFDEQRLAVYYKAVFDDTTAQLFPGIKISHLAGGKGPSFAIAGFWDMQKDAEERGKTSIVFKLVPGMNHFVHWDDPEAAIDIFLECAGIVG